MEVSTKFLSESPSGTLPYPKQLHLCEFVFMEFKVFHSVHLSVIGTERDPPIQK